MTDPSTVGGSPKAVAKHCIDAVKPGQLPPTFLREQKLIRLLATYIATGLAFMLLPGTLLGVWNLFSISAEHASGAAPGAWTQAHGHAQLFGWIGTFILGIGFYSIPNIRRVSAYAFFAGWLAWALWSAGVALRWAVSIYQWQWRLLLPLSAGLELAAVAVFLVASARGHRSQVKATRRPGAWMVLVVAGTLGGAACMALNLAECVRLSAAGSAPIFVGHFRDQFLILSTWGFVVPIVWGFTARWMPAFLGLKSARDRLLLAALGVLVSAIFAALASQMILAAAALLIATAAAVVALRIFEPPRAAAKVSGVHPMFPHFVRIAYIWLCVAALLEAWAASVGMPAGVAGAARHALTVGFFSTMVFSVAPRILPAFLGKQKLFSTRLMLAALLFLTSGCALRVFSQIVAYQGYAGWAWPLLPVSATLELTAVCIFTVNLAATLSQPPAMAVPAGKPL